MTDHDAEVFRASQDTARRMLERVENEEDIARVLYRYNADALCTSKGMLLPGDCMCVAGNCALSSRGVAVRLSPRQLMDRINQGSMSRIFDPDDLNAPDFATRFHSVLETMRTQSLFGDAAFYRVPEKPGCSLEQAVAVYELPGDRERGQVTAVDRGGSGGGYRVRRIPRSSLDGTRECTWEEFNPGGRAVAREARRETPENRNRTSAYQKLKQDYLDGGENRVAQGQETRRASDVPGYQSMRPSERLKLEQQIAEENRRIREAAPGTESAWTPSCGRRDLM